MRFFATLVLGLMAIPAHRLAAPTPTPTPKPVEITEWTVPWERSRPRDPYLDAQGRVWFVGQVGNYLAYLEPKSGEFKRFDLDPGTGPHNLVVAKDGTVWYTGNTATHIGKLDPKTGKITKYPMPDEAARDPHTLIFDVNGDLWFTVQGGNFVGKLSVATGRVRLLPAPTANARPYGIKVDSKGYVWFCEFNTNKMATVNPETMQISEFPLPRPETRPRRMGITSDDAVWYVDYAGGYLGRLDPATRQVKEWPMPDGAKARPYGVAVDDKDRIWFVETGLQPNKFVGFDPKTEQFFSTTDIPGGGGTVRHMFYHRPAQEVWFGTDNNTIGRAKLP